MYRDTSQVRLRGSYIYNNNNNNNNNVIITTIIIITITIIILIIYIYIYVCAIMHTHQAASLQLGFDQRFSRKNAVATLPMVPCSL